MIILYTDTQHRRFLMQWLEQNGVNASMVDYDQPVTVQVMDDGAGGEAPFICWTTLPQDDGNGGLTDPEQLTTPQLTLLPQYLVKSGDGPSGMTRQADDFQQATEQGETSP